MSRCAAWKGLGVVLATVMLGVAVVGEDSIELAVPSEFLGWWSAPPSDPFQVAAEYVSESPESRCGRFVVFDIMRSEEVIDSYEQPVGAGGDTVGNAFGGWEWPEGEYSIRAGLYGRESGADCFPCDEDILNPAFGLDFTDPQVIVLAPSLPEYELGEVVYASFTASDVLSGVSVIDSTVECGQPIDTSTPGVHEFAVTATDCAGNQTTRVVQYYVKASADSAGADTNSLESWSTGGWNWNLWPGWRMLGVVDGDHDFVLSGEGRWQWAVRKDGFNWTDCTVVFRVKLVSGGVHLNFRVGDLTKRTRYLVGFRENTVYIDKELPPDTYTGLVNRAGQVPFGLGVWHDVTVSVWGGELTVEIDHSYQLKYTDPCPLRKGTIAFETTDNPRGSFAGGSEVYVDDVVIARPVPGAAPPFVVRFPDPGLEVAVRNAIHRPCGDILNTDLIGLEVLGTDAWPIANLEGIQHCIDLTYLSGGRGQIRDISPLSALGNLTHLYWNDSGIANINPLSGLSKLEVLSLPDNDIVSIGGLSGLANLTKLDLRDNQIVDISALSGLAKLESLCLYRNEIHDIGPLVANTGIGSGDSVWIWGNQLDLDSPQVMLDILELINRGVTLYWE